MQEKYISKIGFISYGRKSFERSPARVQVLPQLAVVFSGLVFPLSLNLFCLATVSWSATRVLYRGAAGLP